MLWRIKNKWPCLTEYLQKCNCDSRRIPKLIYLSYQSQSLPYSSQDAYRHYEKSEQGKGCPALKKKHLNSNCLRPQLPQTSSFEPSSQLRPQLGPVKNFKFSTRVIFPPPINLLPKNTYKISVLPKESVCPIQNILIDKHVLEMSLDCYLQTCILSLPLWDLNLLPFSTIFSRIWESSL